MPFTKALIQLPSQNRAEIKQRTSDLFVNKPVPCLLAKNFPTAKTTKNMMANVEVISV